jgi:D-xylono/L-arabinono-1,4-lactonase
MHAKPEVVAHLHCRTGENPLWDPVHECVYWTDIPAGKLYKYEVRSGQTSTVYEGQPVGGFTQEADGTLLLFRVHDVARLLPDGHVQPVIEFPHDGADRFNDVIADPEGRVFAGRYASSNEKGGLWRIDTDGSVHKLFTGCACPNGMGFSPDLQTFYFTCTTSRTLYRFRYDRATGEISDRKPFYEAPEEEGLPDGLTVDEAGNLWSARWDGGTVVKLSPQGEVIDRLKVPVAKASSVAFGGLDMKTLFITTAGGSEGGDTDDGALFASEVASQGRLEFRSKILLDQASRGG